MYPIKVIKTLFNNLILKCLKSLEKVKSSHFYWFNRASLDISLAFNKIERIFNQVSQADKFQNVEDGKGIALF